MKSKKKILIIDDDPMVLDAVAEVLERKNSTYEVHTAYHGLRINNEIKKFTPELIILDIRLPWQDGFSVCAAIRKYNSKIKILAVSGYDIADSREKILSSGADAFLSKPFEQPEFIKKVTGLLSV